MDLSKLTPGERIILIAGGVLLIDLLFLPWHDIDIGILSVSRTAIESPKAFWGVLAALVTAAMVAAVVVTRFTSAKLPELPVPLGQAMFLGGVGVAGLLVLKLLLETGLPGVRGVARPPARGRAGLRRVAHAQGVGGCVAAPVLLRPLARPVAQGRRQPGHSATGYAEVGTTTVVASLSCQVCFSGSHSIQK